MIRQEQPTSPSEQTLLQSGWRESGNTDFNHISVGYLILICHHEKGEPQSHSPKLSVKFSRNLLYNTYTIVLGQNALFSFSWMKIKSNFFLFPSWDDPEGINKHKLHNYHQRPNKYESYYVTIFFQAPYPHFFWTFLKTLPGHPPSCRTRYTCKSPLPASTSSPATQTDCPLLPLVQELQILPESSSFEKGVICSPLYITLD